MSVKTAPSKLLGGAEHGVWPTSLALSNGPSSTAASSATSPVSCTESASPLSAIPETRPAGRIPTPPTEVEAERQRIAQELHDGAVQLLGCVRLNVERLLSQGKLEQRAVRTELELCLEWLDAGLIELRHSIVGLREGRGESLQPSLQRLLEDIRRFYKLDVRLVWRVDGPLPESVESTVLRIAQEALHNAAKYAHADRVTVSVESDGPQLVLTVEDNGVGIDEQALRADGGSGRYGLMNMREKAAVVGGVVAIDGRVGQGTRVALILPLTSNTAWPTAS